VTARTVPVRRVLRVPSQSVTSGCALKRGRDEFDIDVVGRKFDQLYREVGR
jgi:hypothetical protein